LESPDVKKAGAKTPQKVRRGTAFVNLSWNNIV